MSRKPGNDPIDGYDIAECILSALIGFGIALIVFGSQS